MYFYAAELADSEFLLISGVSFVSCSVGDCFCSLYPSLVSSSPQRVSVSDGGKEASSSFPDSASSSSLYSLMAAKRNGMVFGGDLILVFSVLLQVPFRSSSKAVTVSFALFPDIFSEVFIPCV